MSEHEHEYELLNRNSWCDYNDPKGHAWYSSYKCKKCQTYEMRLEGYEK